MEGGKALVDKEELSNYKNNLVSFRDTYQQYIGSANRSYGTSSDRLRTQLHEKVPLVTNIVAIVHGGGQYFQDKEEHSFYATLAYALNESVIMNRNWPQITAHVDGIISEAIGRIDSGIFPRKKIHPILSIKDHQLSKRCLDILNAPGSFDRVINQATQVLEDRLRSRLPFEKLCEIIPEAKNQIGENLAHKLLASPNPAIVVSDKPEECTAFHRMVVGIIAYLRNPSHHSLNDDTEWSLAWSVVGIVDSLLSELDNSYISGEEPKPKKKGKKK